MARVKPSPTGAVVARAAELKAAGRDIISMGAGEPDFDTPEHIKAAAVAAIGAGATKYTPIDGTRELKDAIRRKFIRDNDLDYARDQVIVCTGGKQALFNLCLALLGPGDEAVIPAPYWVSYPDMVKIAEAEPVIVPTGIAQDFKMTPAQLEDALTERTRLVFLNSPSNPTGACYTHGEIEALGAVIERFPDVVVVSDDLYEHVHWAEEPFVSFATACPALVDRTVTVNGVSKAYAMTGWRIGYAGGPADLVKAMKTIQSQSTTNPCSVSQAAALAALEGDQAPVAAMTAEYKARHDYLVEALNTVPGFECRAGEGTFYAFPKIAGAAEKLGVVGDVAFCEHLIENADLALVPGSAFGADNYVRFSFACSMAALKEAVKRLKRAVPA
jgi:aspartate aminotransferase